MDRGLKARIKDEGGRMKAARWVLIFAGLVAFCLGCRQNTRRPGIPGDAQTVIDTAIQDIDAGRYENLYNEAGDEWRKGSTREESKATLQRLHDKLGRAQVRNLDNAREERTGTAPIPGHSLIAVYQTQFEHGDAMETFTLIEHGGKWYLAKYFVTSTALR